MSIYYGFFDPVNHDRVYNAEQFNAVTDYLINDGVWNGYSEISELEPMVENASLRVDSNQGKTFYVRPGRAWLLDHWFEIPPWQECSLPGYYDSSRTNGSVVASVALECNVSRSVRNIRPISRLGTYAYGDATPIAPTFTNTQEIKYLVLANITYSYSTDGYTTSVTDLRGTSQCPWITPKIPNVPYEQFFAKWDGDFDTWFAGIKMELAEDDVTNLQRIIDELSAGITVFQNTIPPKINAIGPKLSSVETKVNNIMKYI